MKKKIVIIALVFLLFSNIALSFFQIGLINFRLNQLSESYHQSNDGEKSITIELIDVEKTKKRLVFISVLITGINVLVFYSVFLKLTDKFINRIASIRDGVTRIAGGDYSRKIEFQKMMFFKKEENDFDIIIEGINKMQLEVAKREMNLKEKQEALTGLLKILSQKDDELRKSYEFYRIISEETNDGIFIVDWTDHRKVSLTKTKEILGYEDSEITTFDEWISMIHPDDLESGQLIFDKHLKGEIPLVEYEYRFRAKNGEYKWIYTRAKATFTDKREPKQLIGSNTYIHPRKVSEERIKNLAYFDQMTKLPNRYMLYESMADRITRYKKDYKMFAVILVNLNKFKHINDILGYELGDNLLRQVSDKLRSLVDPEDFLGRMGGDEFIILVDIKDSDDLFNKMEAVAALFKYNWIVEERSFHITASIGASIYPQDGINRSELLKSADVALHNSKENQKNKYSIFDSMMNHLMIEKHQMEHDLRKAIINNEITVFYQPKVSNKTREINGFEALARWIKPDGSLVRPDIFIPVAEETGIIVEIGRIVLSKACEKIVELSKNESSEINIAVNLSAVQFREDNILDTIKEVIRSTGVNPKMLGLEITESVAMENFDHVNHVLGQLRDMGIKISLDDFGTGFSSLNYLQKLKFDILKIDKTFIGEIGNKQNELIIDSLIRIAHGLELEVVAEGVETIEQIKYLENLSCNTYQGYYFSKPIPGYELTIKALDKFKFS